MPIVPGFSNEARSTCWAQVLCVVLFWIATVPASSEPLWYSGRMLRLETKGADCRWFAQPVEPIVLAVDAGDGGQAYAILADEWLNLRLLGPTELAKAVAPSDASVEAANELTLKRTAADLSRRPQGPVPVDYDAADGDCHFRGELHDLVPGTVQDFHGLRFEQLHALVEAQGDARQIRSALDAFEFAKANSLAARVYGTRRDILGAEHRLTLLALSRLADTLHNGGKVAEARAPAEQALELQRKALGEKDRNTLSTLTVLSRIYDDLGIYDLASATADRAYALQIEVLGEDDATTIRTLDQRAYLAYEQGLYREAVRLQEDACARAARVLGDRHQSTLGYRVQLAFDYYEADRVSDALATAEDVHRLLLDTVGERNALTIINLDNIAGFYERLGRYDEAVQFEKRAYDLYVETRGERDAETINATGGMASVLIAAGRPAEALSYAERAYRLSAEEHGEEFADTLTLRSNIGLALTNLGRLPEALDAQEATFEGRRRLLGEDHPSTLFSLQAVGQVRFLMGEQEKAIELLERACRGQETSAGASSAVSSGCLELMASAYIAAGRESDAILALRKIVSSAEAERIRGDLSSENRQALLAKSAGAYKQLAVLWVRRGGATQAMQLAELSKARTLLESLTLRRADDVGGLAADEQARLRANEESLSEFNEQLARRNLEPKDRVRLEGDKNALLREDANYRRELQAKYPKYAQLSDVAIVDAAQGRLSLPRDTAFISYLVAEDRMIAFTLSRDRDLEVHDLGRVPNLAATCAAYRALLIEGIDPAPRRIWRLADGSFAESLTPPAADAARVTSIAPVRDYLSRIVLGGISRNIDRYPRWVISPDGALALIPFETLRTGEKPVLRTHDVSYVQSLSVLTLLRARERDYSRLTGRLALFAMGAAQYELATEVPPASDIPGATAGINMAAYVAQGGSDPGMARRAYDLMGARWPPLPASEHEVDTVAGVFGAAEVTVLKHADASEERLQALNDNHSLARFRYLLFSTHGYLSPDVPSLSAIVLSQVGTTPRADGYVTAAEWPAYDLKSDLIVLSACETALGKQAQGEGILGLPFALFVAGNRNAVLSLWQVVDASTGKFMVKFFARLRAGVPQVRALADTKREFVRSGAYQAEAYWAPFVLYGI
jgi:CHAT domain-containing protein